MRLAAGLSAILMGLAVCGAADIPGTIVEDLTGSPVGNYSANPVEYLVLGDAVFAAVEEPYLLTPGQGEGFHRIRKLNADRSYPRSLHRIGGQVVFTAETDDRGRELHVSDGTFAGTKLLAEFVDGPFGGEVLSSVEFGGRLFMVVDHDSADYRIWFTDGTPEGTGILFNPPPDLENFRPIGMAVANGVLFFSWSTGFFQGLWVTDGTEAGTMPLGTMRFGGESNEFPYIHNHLDRAWFIGFEAGAHHLFVSDGTVEGTTSVMEFPSLPRDFRAAEGLLCVVANRGNGRELISFTGVDGSHEVVPLSVNLSYRRDEFVQESGAGLIYFAFRHLDSERLQLWRTDGTPQGTHWIDDDVYRPIGPCGPYYYYSAAGEQGFIEVHRTDGTPEGTLVVHEPAGQVGSYPGPDSACLDGLIYFTLDDGVHGREAWTSDGTAEGTRLYADIGPVQTGSTTFEGLLPAPGGGLWLETSPRQLWYTTGEPGSMVPVGQHEAREDWAATEDGRLFFVADQAGAGRELWVTSAAGPTATFLKDIHPGPSHSSIGNLHPLGSGVVFLANDGVHGREPWWSDGTADNTFLLADVAEGSPSASVSSFAKLADRLWFLHNAGDGDLRIWQTDGTVSGTTTTVHFSGFPYPVFSRLGVLNGSLNFFAWDEGSTTTELWRSDGTLQGTKRVAGAGHLVMGPQVVYGRELVVWAGTNLTAGTELWVSDGTEPGTRLAGDIFPGSESSDPSDFALVGKKVYFRASERAGSLRPLYCYDHAADSLTQLTGDSPHLSSRGFEPVNFDGLAVFVGRLFGSPAMLITDGTVANTLAVPVNDRLSSQGAENLVVSGRHLYYVGTGYLGRELWVIRRDSLSGYFETNQWVLD